MWLLFALLTACFQAFQDVAIRAHKRADSLTLSCLVTAAGGAAMLTWALTTGATHLEHPFWLALPFGGGLNALAFYLYYRTLHSADLSLALPMLAFTPVFMLVTAPLIVGDYPTPLGGLGMACIVAGSYGLKLQERDRGWLEPFRALLRDRATRTMLVISFIWSITSNIDKIGVRSSSMPLWLAGLFSTISLVLAPMAVRRLRTGRGGEGLGRAVPLVAVLLIATGVSQMAAITAGPTPYVMAVKRTSILIAGFLGVLLLHEPRVKGRFAAGAAMVVGVFCIAVG